MKSRKLPNIENCIIRYLLNQEKGLVGARQPFQIASIMRHTMDSQVLNFFFVFVLCFCEFSAAVMIEGGFGAKSQEKRPSLTQKINQLI